jgi:hypothetical protein
MLLLNKKLRNLIGKRFIAFGKALRKLLPFCKRKNSVGASTTAVVYFSRRRVDDPVLNNNNNNGMIGNLAGGLNNNDHSPLPQGDPPASPMVAKITTAPRIN